MDRVLVSSTQSKPLMISWEGKGKNLRDIKRKVVAINAEEGLDILLRIVIKGEVVNQDPDLGLGLGLKAQIVLNLVPVLDQEDTRREKREAAEESVILDQEVNLALEGEEVIHDYFIEEFWYIIKE